MSLSFLVPLGITLSSIAPQPRATAHHIQASDSPTLSEHIRIYDPVKGHQTMSEESARNGRRSNVRLFYDEFLAFHTPHSYRHTELTQRIHASQACITGSLAYSFASFTKLSDSVALLVCGFLSHLAFLYVTQVWSRRLSRKPGLWIAYFFPTVAFETLSWSLSTFSLRIRSPELELSSLLCFLLFWVSIWYWYRRAYRA